LTWRGTKEATMSKVLIIDDDRMVRETIKIILESAGHAAFLAGNGREGLKIFTAAAPDIVITDILMPEKEGIETIAELRRLKPDLPIVAISGGGRVGNMNFLKAAESFGANHTLTKPFEPEEILRLVAELTPAATA
jgi:CheY-like chemotaxis protein